jgi:RNA polymerase subunit RPABC4/transcription elongation factor Spt4
MEGITSLIVGAASIIGAILAALLGGLTIWAFRDIRSRTRDPFVQVLATVMVGVVPIAGILVYLMLRPRETLSEGYVRALEEESLLSSIESQEFCPTCGRRVDHDMQWCPACHSKLRNACGSCGRAVHLSWDLCPYCGVAQQPEIVQSGGQAKVAKPQAKRVPTPAAPRAAIPQAEAAAKIEAPLKSTVTAASGAAANAGNGAGDVIGGVLDRVGSAVGSVVDRVNARIQNTGANPRVELPDDNGHSPTELDMPPVNGTARPKPGSTDS